MRYSKIKFIRVPKKEGAPPEHLRKFLGIELGATMTKDGMYKVDTRITLKQLHEVCQDAAWWFQKNTTPGTMYYFFHPDDIEVICEINV